MSRANRKLYVYLVLLLCAGIVAWVGHDRFALSSRAPEGMVWIAGGEFWMGSDFPMFRDAQPVHRVHIDGFFLDKT